MRMKSTEVRGRFAASQRNVWFAQTANTGLFRVFSPPRQ